MSAVADEELLDILAMIRARGAIGESSLPRAVAHADEFVPLIPSDSAVVDLGSGGGLPGLVIAVRRPELQVTLVERRENRADLLRRAVAALRLGGSVTVLAGDVRSVARAGETFDVVTARSFAAPLTVAQLAAPLCRAGGLALVSEPPDSATADSGRRWPAADLQRFGWSDEGLAGSIRRLRRRPSA